MAFMDNAVKPQNPEEVKPDVAEEDDPTIPKKEKDAAKEKEADKKSASEEKPQNPLKPESVLMPLSAVQELTKSIMRLSNTTLELKMLMSDSHSDVSILKNSYFQIREDARDMSDNVQEFKDMLPVFDEMALNIANIKIKWDMTIKPITDQEIQDGINKSKYKEEYTKLNNILSEINDLKKTIEKQMFDMQRENPSGYARTDEYRDLYSLGMIVMRLFNQWPQEMKYFKKDGPAPLEMTKAMAERLDVTDGRDKAKQEEWMNQE